ncbi:Galectin-8 [Heterocephalus glaber]|uniref:Galectin n=1 Tax=Heterocephalus glaber TaxID=10181 RepID=G5AXU5_HETGA|nr:Galectin-8 [Heterocephalus glaber]
MNNIANERATAAFPFPSGDSVVVTLENTLTIHVRLPEMIIYCDPRDFKVAINGAHSLENKHRFLDLGSIDTVAINGDIHLLEVRNW